MSIFALSFFSLCSAEQEELWKAKMDEFIISNSTQGKIHISYQSLENQFDQYHRNANAPIQSSDLIKFPILIYCLEDILDNKLDEEEVFKISEKRIIVNKQGMIGKEDVGKFFTTEQLLFGLLKFNDNVAANLIIDRVGKDNIVSKLRAINLNSTYLKGEFNDHTKNEVSGAGNFISSGDFSNFLKKSYLSIMQTHKGELLLKKYLADSKPSVLTFTANEESTLNMTEDTKLVKGSFQLKLGKASASFIIMVSDFKDEATALRLVEEAQALYNARFEKISSN